MPHTVVSEEVAAQIAEDTAVENGFRLNDVTLMHAVTQLVKEDGTGRPVWVVSRTYRDNDTEQIHQYHAAIDAQTGDMQYDTKFYFEKVHDWENELQCDNEFGRMRSGICLTTCIILRLRWQCRRKVC